MNGQTQKTSYFLSVEAIQAVERHAESPHKRGEWLSAAALYYAKVFDIDDPGAGVLEQIINRLARLEAKLDRVLEGNKK